mgnify:CR=1 FL=1
MAPSQQRVFYFDGDRHGAVVYPFADTPGLADFVAGQLGPDAMADAAALGFRSVVNNRPDFEHGPDSGRVSRDCKFRKGGAGAGRPVPPGACNCRRRAASRRST